MHELGHAIHPLGNRFAPGSDPEKIKADAEYYAWEWARANALTWTKGMQRSQDISEASHAGRRMTITPQEWALMYGEVPPSSTSSQRVALTEEEINAAQQIFKSKLDDLLASLRRTK